MPVFWRFRARLGRPLAPSLTLGLNFFPSYILESIMYEAAKFGFSGSFTFRDMKAQTLSFVQCHVGHVKHAKFSKYGPENGCRSYALFRRFGTR